MKRNFIDFKYDSRYLLSMLPSAVYLVFSLLWLAHGGLSEVVQTEDCCLISQLFHIFKVYFHASHEYNYDVELMEWSVRWLPVLS